MNFLKNVELTQTAVEYDHLEIFQKRDQTFEIQQ